MTAPLGAPLVLVHREVTCPDCHRDAYVTTDGTSAYTESVGLEFVGGSREGTIVSTLCPAPERHDPEGVCRGTLLVDLGEEEAWEPASSELLARLSLAGRLEV
jgi:hypothetical protein